MRFMEIMEMSFQSTPQYGKQITSLLVGVFSILKHLYLTYAHFCSSFTRYLKEFFRLRKICSKLKAGQIFRGYVRRIIPVDGYVVNNHGTIPLINGLFIAYKWRLLTTHLLSGMILQVSASCEGILSISRQLPHSCHLLLAELGFKIILPNWNCSLYKVYLK